MTWFGYVLMGWLAFGALASCANDRNPSTVKVASLILSCALIVGIMAIGTGSLN